MGDKQERYVGHRSIEQKDFEAMLEAWNIPLAALDLPELDNPHCTDRRFFNVIIRPYTDPDRTPRLSISGQYLYTLNGSSPPTTHATSFRAEFPWQS